MKKKQIKLITKEVLTEAKQELIQKKKKKI